MKVNTVVVAITGISVPMSKHLLHGDKRNHLLDIEYFFQSNFAPGRVGFTTSGKERFEFPFVIRAGPAVTL
jgi:hypothetical protein